MKTEVEKKKEIDQFLEILHVCKICTFFLDIPKRKRNSSKEMTVDQTLFILQFCEMEKFT